METEKIIARVITMMDAEKIRSKIGIKSSGMVDSVWFQPSEGRFLFFDMELPYEVALSLINLKEVIFKEYSFHQGEKMLRYMRP